jgi:hypothetical protein
MRHDRLNSRHLAPHVLAWHFPIRALQFFFLFYLCSSLTSKDVTGLLIADGLWLQFVELNTCDGAADLTPAFASFLQCFFQHYVTLYKPRGSSVCLNAKKQGAVWQAK